MKQCSPNLGHCASAGCVGKKNLRNPPAASVRELAQEPNEAIAMFDPEGEARFIEDCRATIGSKTVLSLLSAICESSGSRTPMPSSQ